MKTGFLQINGELGNATALLPLAQTHTINLCSSAPLHVPWDIHVPVCLSQPPGQSCRCSGAVPMLVSWRTAAGQHMECPGPSQHTSELGTVLGSLLCPVTTFQEMCRNLIIFETFTPFQISLRLASRLKTFLHVDSVIIQTSFPQESRLIEIITKNTAGRSITQHDVQFLQVRNHCDYKEFNQDKKKWQRE